MGQRSAAPATAPYPIQQLGRSRRSIRSTLLRLAVSAVLAGCALRAHFRLALVILVGDSPRTLEKSEVISHLSRGDSSGDASFRIVYEKHEIYRGTTTYAYPQNQNRTADAPFVVPESFRHHSFPRWGSELQKLTLEEPRGGAGIDMASLLEFIDGIVQEESSVGPYTEALVYVWGHGLEDDSLPRLRNPKQGLWASEMLRSRTVNTPMRYRMVPRFKAVESALKRAWDYLSSRIIETVAKERWPALIRVMNDGFAFPIILWHSDFKGCNHNNFKTNQSVPLLTTCANVRCNHSFPFPSYRTVKDSLRDSTAWDAYLKRQAAESLWRLKRNQVVWRGSLTGPLPRIRLGVFAAQHKSNSLIDIGIHRLPGNKSFSDEVLQKVLMKPPIPAENFSDYKAILDIDGNSWSARFGRLLCRNSVIVKVEPEYVDYFYKHLTPWKHYVPIREDLGDLLEVIEWLLDAANEDHVLQIVASANDWCRTHLTDEGVTHDILDILNAYVGYLDQNDANWGVRWEHHLAGLWDPQSGLDMRKLP